MHRRRLTLLMLVTCLFAVGVTLPKYTSAASQQNPQTLALSCYINLTNNTHTCPLGGPLSFKDAPSGGRAVLRVNLHPSYGYTRAAFRVYYGGTPSGWTVDIGDSISNDGGGGDGYHQSNDAETQVYGRTLSVIGNDQTPCCTKLLREVNSVVSAGHWIQLEAMNQQVNWTTSYNYSDGHASPYLYALAGQWDYEQGGTNYDIYAAFNRTVKYRSDRLGSGATSVEVTLHP